MRKSGSNRESIFTLYLKKNPKVIKDLITLSIEGIRVEEKVGRKRIDLYAINRERKIEIFIENQMKPSDRFDHLKDKVSPLINSISEGYLLWIAVRFQQEHIDEIKQLLRNNPHKYINFYAVEIQPEVLNQIDSLNNCYELEKWNKLDTINEIYEKLRVIDFHLQMPETHIGRAYIRENNYDFDSDYGIKKYLMERFCEKIPYYLNFHYSKKDLKDNKQLTIGAGIGTITYFCSIPSKKRNNFVVGIRFEWSLSNVYQYFCEKEELLKKNISPDIYFKDKERTINFSIKSDRNNIPAIADQIAEVLERFILFFSPYTYGGKIKDILVQLEAETGCERKLG